MEFSYLFIAAILLIGGTYLMVIGAEPMFKHKPSRKGFYKVVIGELMVIAFFFELLLILNG